MGVTLTALSDGTVMDASVVTARFTTIQTWQNGNIATSDLVASSIPTRAFRRMEHYAAVNPRSYGVTGTTGRGTVDTDPGSRVYANVDAHGKAIWADVSTMTKSIRAEDAGRVEVVFEWWAWAIQTNASVPENLDACDFRIMVAGTAVADSEVRLFDAATDPNTAGNDGGQFVYPARNFQAIAQRVVGSAGVVTVKLQVKVLSQGAGATNRAQYALIIIGARNKHVEFWRM